MEQQNSRTGFPFSWWGVICGTAMVGIFFDLHKYVTGPPYKALIAPLLGTLVPRDPLVTIAWLVIITLPLSWFWVRALMRRNYENAFCCTYSFAVTLVPWTWGLLSIPVNFLLPSSAGIVVSILDAVLLTVWFVVISVVTVVSSTIIERVRVRLGHDGLPQ
ncbi:MAG: hypothetical protein Q8R39_01035 [bacterium]|nr:hypothetical protein [bacterium]